MKNIIKKFFVGAGMTLAGVGMVSAGLGGFCLILFGLPLKDGAEFNPVAFSLGILL